MSLAVKGADAPIAFALVKNYNLLRRSPTVLGAAYHSDQLETTTGDYKNPVATPLTITAPVASDLATSLVLVTQIAFVYERHRVCSGHKASDTTNAVTSPAATNLATAQTLANEIKADYNAHAASAAAHFTADGANLITSANASDQATLNTLLNEMRTDINAHMASAPAGSSILLT